MHPNCRHRTLGTAPLPWLRPLSWLYGTLVRARNIGFEIGVLKARRLAVPVISVGNLCAGGTSKTPLVIWLVERCRAAGLNPGVLARGYRREPGRELNDEGRLLARRFPGLPQAQAPARFGAGKRLLRQHELDLILLDDGFQHRRLHRDLDVCCLDARDPLGGGLLVPAGWLREPPGALERADVVVLTGAERCRPGELETSSSLVRARIGERPCIACMSVVKDVLALPGGTSLARDALRGRRCTVLAGIARPERFKQSLVDLGAVIVHEEYLPDHAPIAIEVLTRLSDEARQGDGWLLMTEKDEARLDLPGGEGPERFVPRIGIGFQGSEPPLSLFLPEPLGDRLGS